MISAPGHVASLNFICRPVARDARAEGREGFWLIWINFEHGGRGVLDNSDVQVFQNFIDEHLQTRKMKQHQVAFCGRFSCYLFFIVVPNWK